MSVIHKRRENKHKHFLSLIVPAYKQEKTIVSNIRRLKTVLDDIRYKYEIILVVDGQVDGTLLRIKKAKLAKTIAISYSQNQGKSFAVRTGMNIARGDYIMFIDAGIEINPNGISMLIEHMEWYKADIIVGSKRHPASYVTYTWQRKLLSYGYYYVVKFLFGLKVHDTQAGIKIFKKKVLIKILPRLLEKKFAGDLEMLVVSRFLGFNRIFEAPIKLNYKFAGLSSAVGLKAIIGIALDTLAIFYRKNLTKYYLKSQRRSLLPADIKIIRF